MNLFDDLQCLAYLVTTILDALYQVLTHLKEMINVLLITLIALKQLNSVSDKKGYSLFSIPLIATESTA